MNPDAGAPIAVDVRHEDGTALVTVDGELEFGTAASLRTTLSDLVQAGAGPVVVDLAALRFIDSSGLSLLVQAKRRFESAGRTFELRHPTPHVVHVIETSGLSELFAIEPEPS